MSITWERMRSVSSQSYSRAEPTQGRAVCRSVCGGVPYQPQCNQSVCSGQLCPCRLLIFRDRLVGLISILFLQLMINMASAPSSTARSSSPRRQERSGNLVRRLALQVSFWKWSTYAAAKCFLAVSSTWATMCFQPSRWIFSRLCNGRTASVTQVGM